MPDVRRLEALWTKIVGVLLILLGVTLIFSPQIAYTGREKIPHTQYSVKHEKTIVIPTAASAVVIGAGVIALLLANRKPQP
jgi:uncharacterized membrane protein HdeD (DUF308 family)